MSSLADGVVSSAVTLVMLLPMMELVYEKSGHMTLLRYNNGVLN